MASHPPLSPRIAQLLRAGNGRQLVDAVLLARKEGRRWLTIVIDGKPRRFRQA